MNLYIYPTTTILSDKNEILSKSWGNHETVHKRKGKAAKSSKLKKSSYHSLVFTCPAASASPVLCSDLVESESIFSIYSSSKVSSLSLDDTRL